MLLFMLQMLPYVSMTEPAFGGETGKDRLRKGLSPGAHFQFTYGNTSACTAKGLAWFQSSFWKPSIR